eukprot:TRINITY_DN9993_c3_g2_i1.p1 TRINITY_DN9993_c3_g2~~TRINITY_DN9993_c3_g2_i1.p1  ORF type:complete len:1457 (+),score=483.96 TRINITY_DN9993_c3_g2_i1:233-4372(+)
MMAVTTVISALVDLIDGTASPYITISSLYITLTWIFAMFLLMREYSRGQRSGWALRAFWTVSFLLYSLQLQTTIAPLNKTPYQWLDVVIAVILAGGAFFMCLTGLFFNRLAEGYERLEDSDIPAINEEERPANPEVTASIISKAIYSWLNGILLLGYKRPLEDSDLYELPPNVMAQNVGRNLAEIWEFEKIKAKPSLVKALAKAYGKEFFIAGVFKLMQDLLMLVGPILLQSIIQFITSIQPNYMGFLYVALMFLASVGQSLSLHRYFHMGFRVGMQAKTGVIALIYEKSFKLSNKAKQKSTVGEMVNLQAIDANRLQEYIPYLHVLWSAPLQMIVSLVLLWRLLGPSVIAGIGVMVLVIPFNGFLTKKLLTYQKAIMKLRDERTKTINEVFTGIRIIKFFAWESNFKKRIEDIRNQELASLRSTLVLKALMMLLWATVPTFVSVFTFTVYVLVGNTLTAEAAFTSLALFNIIRFPLQVLPGMITQTIEIRVSFDRLRDFLMADELDPRAVDRPSSLGSDSIRIENGFFSWDESLGTNTLSDITVNFPQGKLIAIVGAVGSGKSTLLSAIMGEVKKSQGNVSVVGSTAYVAQQAWILNATVKDNIVFGSLWDEKKYHRVLQVCELAQDLAMLPNGDKTEIGEKGINLSGGQKQRISLARAVYQDLDIYLLDDCLSAVDVHVGKKIFDHAISGALSKKTRLLVTHQLQFVSAADIVIVLKDGRISEMGNFDELMERQSEFHTLIKTHVSASGGKYQVGEEEHAEVPAKTETEKPKEEKKGTGKIIAAEERETGEVKRGVYKIYAQSLGGICVAAFIIATYVMDTGAKIGGDFWLSYWSSGESIFSQHVSLGIYASLGLGAGVIVFLRTIMINLTAINSAKFFHNAMISKVMRAPTSFFDTTPLGRILNRFTKDVNTIDESLPRTLGMFLSMCFGAGSVFFVIMFVSPFFLTILLPLGYFYRHIQKYYLQSSRELKRLESISKSPIYAQFSETLAGLGTIRPYNKIDQFIVINNRKLDTNMSAYYILTAANRWLGVRLEFIGTLVVTMAAGLAVIEKGNIEPGIAGLAITYALQLTGSLNWLVRMATEVETQMVSIERAMDYVELRTEAAEHIPSTEPKSDWPAEGAIAFEDVELRYREGLDLVLRGISMKIRPREKVGVVGRTGAGKSSLMLALFRMVELSGGKITIDGVDISTIGTYALRSKLSIIPQDPTLFTGTIRDNLDPFNERTDLQIWEALGSVNLKDTIEKLPLKLEAPVVQYGDNFSVGQKQLLCLCRALLRRSTILVMDEATAAVDFETDALIQKTIRQEFKDVTVLTIAHRINTIIDYDKVLVLDKGLVAEFDRPDVLLNDPTTIFSHMNRKHVATQEDVDIMSPEPRKE